ncbi:serine protease [Nonomuraea sp. C10]|uniref:serine protease n=1 Tax=Nonomuraea sp. C10 TaxID=2600577 RepID=UPI0011CDB0D1|nr:serine protease [Nonomuraea sp. C10]TXK34656.1 NACHT domain-containing protein [Nonomuraea sp. C10]
MVLTDRLPLALQRATVSLSSQAGTGTGFFVAPRVVLTCAHVVSGEDGVVRGEWQGSHLDLRLDDRSRGDKPPDLAALHLQTPADHPFVALAPSVSLGDDLWSWGYPMGSYSSGDSVTLKYDGPSQRHDGELIRASGARLTPGFSGAPVLNRRTGGVCGVVRLGDRKDPVIRLVSADKILETYPELSRHHRPPHTNIEWLDLLEDEQLHAGAWRYPSRRVLSYLKALRGFVRSHPYAVPLPNTPPLSTVYLRQHGVSLQRTTEDDSLINLPGPQSADPGLSGRQQLFTRHRNTLILGRPGAGKSSLLRYVAEIASRDWLLTKDCEFVPVYVPGRALSSRNSFSAALAAAVSRELGTWLDASLPDDWFSRQPIPGVPWLLLVDGIDEIFTVDGRREALNSITHRRSAEDYRFLIASRPLPKQEIDQLLRAGTGAYEILPFSPDQLLTLAEQWFKALAFDQPRPLAERFRAELERSRIAHLARVPLLATMLCVVFAGHPAQGIPHSRAELYERFITLLMSKQYRHVDIYERLDRRAKPYGSEARRAVRRLLERSRHLLERLASTRHRGDQRPFIDLAQTWTASLRPSCMPEDEWAQILEDLLRQSGVMTQRRGEFVFVHMTVEEYLAAQYTAYNLTSEVANYLVFFQGGEQSYRQFLAHACVQRGISFEAGALNILRNGKPDDAMFVAALLRDGVELGDVVRTTAVNRLGRMSASSKPGDSAAVALRTGAAHELVYLSPEKGLTPLRGIAENPRVSHFDRIEAAKKLVELDFGLGVGLLRDLVDAFTSTKSGDCLQAARYLLEFDASLGLEALQRIARNPHLNDWTRLTVAVEIGEWDKSLSRTILMDLAVDSQLGLLCRLDAIELLGVDTVPNLAASLYGQRLP